MNKLKGLVIIVSGILMAYACAFGLDLFDYSDPSFVRVLTSAILFFTGISSLALGAFWGLIVIID